ncbi:MAG TPA: hypothetical protein VFQ41_13585 [Candidatus Angelobacter sp.]|nr:hypothetical protein [Candidatus Angelobacter sp.]
MRRKLLLMRSVFSFAMSAIILFLSGVQSSSPKLEPPASTQSRETVQKFYGSPIREVYRTSQDLTITASFASNGNLCRADIRAESDAGITDSQLNVVLNELAPEAVRGKFKLGTFLNITCLKVLEQENSAPDSSKKPAMELTVDPCAECSGVSEDYERVKITKYGNTNRHSSVHVTFKQPECEGLDNASH